MSGIDWQNIIAITLVAIAAIYLAWRVRSVFARRKSKGCGAGCSTCSQEAKLSSAPEEVVIPIEDLAASIRKIRQPTRL